MKTVKKDIIIPIGQDSHNTSIFISLKVSIDESGVLFNRHNGVYYNGKILFTSEDVPSDLKIVNKASELIGRTVRLYSRYNVVAPTEDETKFPKVKWEPNLEAGDDTLYDEEEEESSDDNMFEFILTFEFKEG